MDTAHHTSFDNISGQMMFQVNKVGKLHANFSHHMNRDLFLVLNTGPGCSKQD